MSLFIGIFIGSVIGFFAAGLCCASKSGELERQLFFWRQAAKKYQRDYFELRGQQYDKAGF